MTGKHILLLFMAMPVLAALCGCLTPAAADLSRYPASGVVMSAGAPSPLLEEKDMIMSWTTLGPFLTVYGENHPLRSSLHYEHLPKEKDLSLALTLPPYLEWRAAKGRGETPLACDFNAAWPDAKVIYAIKHIYCESGMEDVALLSGCSGFFKIWLNGKLIYTYDYEERPGAVDQGQAGGLTLRRGMNVLLVKTVRTSPEWLFYCRLSSGGHPLRLVDKQPEIINE